MTRITDPSRRTRIALAAVGTLLAVAYVLVPRPTVQYTAWLIVFTIWMVWFVLAAVEWLSRADF